MLEMNDVTIIGSGPAGLQAAISAASELPRVAIIDRALRTGGAAGTSSHIENIAGYDESGSVITNRMTRAARKHGARFILGQKVTQITAQGNVKVIHLENGTFILSKTVVLATGLHTKPLNIPGESTYVGKDVMYGSVLSKGRACKGLPIAIVGGANSAGQLALYAAQFASYVTVIIRGNTISKGMSEYLVTRVNEHPRINVIDNAHVTEVRGDARLKSVIYKRYNEVIDLPICILFVCAGFQPNTKWIPDAITRDNEGFIVADGQFRHETKMPGVFVIGDVNASSVKRVGGAIGQGTEVVTGIHSYLQDKTFAL